MSYKITFDNKAKEIIKTVVNNGDTPTPTPTPTPAGASFRVLKQGGYIFHADKLLEILIAKGIDVDAELEETSGSDSGIVFGLAVANNYSFDMSGRLNPFYLAGNLGSGLQFTIQLGTYDNSTSGQTGCGDTFTYRTFLEGLCTYDEEGIYINVSSQYDITYIPALGLQAGSNAAMECYNLTDAEFDTILEYVEYPEEEALEL